LELKGEQKAHEPFRDVTNNLPHGLAIPLHQKWNRLQHVQLIQLQMHTKKAHDRVQRRLEVAHLDMTGAKLLSSS
jgi:hypothetical protein